VQVMAEKGKVTKLECVKNRLGPPDEDGRRRPLPIKGSHFFMAVDQIISAIGEEADLSGVPKQVGIKENVIRTDERGGTKQGRIFAGGDIIHQPHTVVHAIASGKRAAIFMDCFLQKKTWEGLFDVIRIGERGSLSVQRYLQEETERPPIHSPTVRLKDLNLDYFDYKKRRRMPKASLAKRVGSFEEVNLGFSEETAVEEAQRCFNCGVCNLCDNCYILCPDVAILKQGEDRPNIVDYDHCKGCGICVEECPRHAMVMEEEVK
jgi:Pyruvate/2-oxoacid:ferredoxin oxidoreductase delta subunit